MSEVENPCLFDNTKECAIRKAFAGHLAEDVAIEKTLEKGCPMCPIHQEIMKPKGSFK